MLPDSYIYLLSVQKNHMNVAYMENKRERFLKEYTNLILFPFSQHDVNYSLRISKRKLNLFI